MGNLDHIPVKLKLAEIGKRLHLEKGKEWRQAKTLVEAAQSLITARAFYKVSYIESKNDDEITIEGFRLTSRVLRKHLDNVGRVFPYICTIGHELEERARVCTDLVEQYYLDTIGNIALGMVREYLEDRLSSKYALDSMSYMSPGSLGDWPIEEQRPLFSILGDVEDSIGVRLNESLLMIPSKSVSGIYFPTKVPFFSCQLCPRKDCPSRRAKYDKKLAKRYDILK